MNKEAKISCKNIWKLYGEAPEKFLKNTNNNPTTEEIKKNNFIPAVRDASIDVNTGEILVIMGLSGSGKSTLLRCMSKLIEPTYGQVFFEGNDLLKASEKELIDIRRHKMGMVFQHFALLPHRTVLSNTYFGLQIRGIKSPELDFIFRDIYIYILQANNMIIIILKFSLINIILN